MNPSFEDGSTRFLDINTDRGVEKPAGWSVEWYQGAKDQNGMTFNEESMTQDSKTWNAKSNKAYFARMRWTNSTLYLRQTMSNLLPGKYTLSFSAAAHTAAEGKNQLSVSVAGQKKDCTVVSNETGSWTDYTLDFTITSATPYATIEIKAEREDNLFKFGIDDFTLTYDGSTYYQTAIEEATALYNANNDWATGAADLNEAITSASGKSTVADINAAIIALQEAVATFKNANTVDVTLKINNPNFDSNIEGWTLTGGDGNAFGRQTSSQENFNGGFLEKWRNGWNGGYNQKNLDIQQTLNNLPNGEYTVKAAVIAQMQGDKETFNANSTYVNKKHGGPYYISDEHGVWLYGTSGENSAAAWANTQNPTFTTGAGGEYKTATIKVENGTLTIGLKAIGSPNGGTELGTYANWIACDNWTLSYFGFDATGLVADAKSEAAGYRSLLSEKMYSVTSSELEAALDAVDALEGSSATKSQIDAAVNTMREKKDAADASIADYATLNTNITYAEAYTPVKPGTTGYAEAIQAAKDAYNNGTVETVAATIKSLTDYKVADYTWAKESYTEEATLSTWTNTFAEQPSNEGYGTDGTKYYNTWGSATHSVKQTVKLPAGDYILYGAGRGSTAAEYAKLYYKIGENEPVSVNYLMKGNTGLGIDTNGDANFSTEGTYTRENAGMGWEYRFIAFSLTEETDVEIGTEAKFAGTWVSVYAPKLYTTEASIKALRLNEIAAALGAENANVPTGKMNATVASTLAEKVQAAENATAGNTKDELATILSDLKEAISAANTSVTNYSSVAAVNTKAAALDAAGQAAYAETLAAYNNGTLTQDGEVAQAKTAYVAAVKAQTSDNAVFTGALNNPSFEDGTNGWTNDRNTTGTYDYRTDAVNPAEGSKTLNVWAQQFNYSNVWQKQTLPAGHYTLSAKVRTNAEPLNTEDKNTQLRTYVNGKKTSNSASLTEWRTENWNAADAWITLTTEFVLAAETEVEMGIYSTGKNVNNNSQGWYQVDDFQLIRVNDDDSQATMAVNATAQYGTFCAPFAVDVPSGVTASTAEINANGYTIDLTSVGATIPANTPVILYSESGLDAQTFYGKSVTGTPTAGVLTGVYTSTTAEEGWYVLQNNDSKVGFYEVQDVKPTVGANRAYLTVPAAEGRVRAFYFDNNANAIEAISAIANNAIEAIYNANGVKVNALQKGINVVKMQNGKTQKVLVK